MIYTFGDSHAVVGWGEIPGVVPGWLGPLTLYAFGNDAYDVLAFKQIDLKDGDAVIYCLGEIDCRCQISKFDEDDSYRQMIQGLVKSYARTVNRMIEQHYAALGVTTCICMVTPPSHETQEDLEYPYMGSDETRKKYHECMNHEIKEMCKLEGFTCFDVYKDYSDKEGFLSLEYSKDVHIVDPRFIIEKIAELGLQG